MERFSLESEKVSFFFFFSFSQIFCDVIPKREALSQANVELEMATAKLLAVQKKLVVSVMLYYLIIQSKRNINIIVF